MKAVNHPALSIAVGVLLLACAAVTLGRYVVDKLSVTPTPLPRSAVIATEHAMQATVDAVVATRPPTATWIPTATPTYPPTPLRTPTVWATWWAERTKQAR